MNQNKSYLIVLKQSTQDEVYFIVKMLKKVGVLVQHIYLREHNNVLIVSIPDTKEWLEKILNKLDKFIACYEGLVDKSSIDSYVGYTKTVLSAWNKRLSEDFSWVKYSKIKDNILYWDKLKKTCPIPSTPVIPHITDLSKYLIGSVVIGMIFVNGPSDDLKFNPEEMSNITAQVQDGLDWLSSQEPEAKITWVYRVKQVAVNTPFADFTVLPGNYLAREEHWRNPTLEVLGVDPSERGVFEYTNLLRNAHKVKSGFLAFFTKYQPFDGMPMYTVPSTSWIVAYCDPVFGDTTLLNRRFAHETCHIFGCPDEYTHESDCTKGYGFLQEPNGNNITCNPSSVNCIMRDDSFELCEYTRIQLGWRDSNANGVLDPIEQDPSV